MFPRAGNKYSFPNFSARTHSILTGLGGCLRPPFSSEARILRCPYPKSMVLSDLKRGSDEGGARNRVVTSCRISLDLLRENEAAKILRNLFNPRSNRATNIRQDSRVPGSYNILLLPSWEKGEPLFLSICVLRRDPQRMAVCERQLRESPFGCRFRLKRFRSALCRCFPLILASRNPPIFKSPSRESRTNRPYPDLNAPLIQSLILLPQSVRARYFPERTHSTHLTRSPFSKMAKISMSESRHACATTASVSTAARRTCQPVRQVRCPVKICSNTKSAGKSSRESACARGRSPRRKATKMVLLQCKG